MTTADKLSKLAHLEAEIKRLTYERNRARESGDEPHFRWYAERVIKLQDEYRILKWGD